MTRLAASWPLLTARFYSLLTSCNQVEEQQQDEKKGKAKASGKRFEIKKWNAVAM